jgi:hypothetical protein
VDVAPNGVFALTVRDPEVAPEQAVLIQNWTEELKARVPIP